MSDFLSYLARKRQEANNQIKHYTELLRDIDRSEALYRESQLASAAGNMTATSSFVGHGFVDHMYFSGDLPTRPTLKARIIAALKVAPKGLRSGELLAVLQSTGTPELQRTSMSPQLSRLQADGDVVNDNGTWRLAKNNEAAGSADPAASSNSGPEPATET